MARGRVGARPRVPHRNKMILESGLVEGGRQLGVMLMPRKEINADARAGTRYFWRANADRREVAAGGGGGGDGGRGRVEVREDIDNVEAVWLERMDDQHASRPGVELDSSPRIEKTLDMARALARLWFAAVAKPPGREPSRAALYRASVRLLEWDTENFVALVVRRPPPSDRWAFFDTGPDQIFYLLPSGLERLLSARSWLHPSTALYDVTGIDSREFSQGELKLFSDEELAGNA
jgi:hypothetical protein